MGQSEISQSNAELQASQSAQAVLRALAQEMYNLRKDMRDEISQDMARLRAEKTSLLDEIERLQSHVKLLQTKRIEALSDRQVAQQQVWARSLAQALFSHLQGMLNQARVEGRANPSLGNFRGGSTLSPPEDFSDRVHRLLASLDSAFNSTFQSLQRELNSYQSSLSKQLRDMHDMEQRSEAILAALLNKLQEQMNQADARERGNAYAPTGPDLPENLGPKLLDPTPASALGRSDRKLSDSAQSRSYPSQSAELPRFDSRSPNRVGRSEPAIPKQPAPVPAIVRSTAPGLSSNQPVLTGIILALCSAIFLSLFNVGIRVLLKEQTILGVFQWGGIIGAGLGNSLLVLALRMVFALPLTALIAPYLYPPVWQDVERFSRSRSQSMILGALGSGLCLFVSQVLIYLAFGKAPVGIVVTVFFIYPIATVFLSSIFFGERLTPFRLFFTAIVLSGVGLISLQTSGAPNLSILGPLAAAGAGLSFAGYVLLTQFCSGPGKLNSTAVSLIHFLTILVMSGLMLLLVPFKVSAANLIPLLVAVFLLSLLTLGGYLCNNFAIRFTGGAMASIVGTTGPVLSGLFAWILIGETLKLQQLGGMALVTSGVVALSLERMRSQAQGVKAASTNK